MSATPRTEPPTPPETGQPTIGHVLRRAEAYLARHGVQEPKASAHLLLANALGTDRAGLASGSRVMDPAEARAFGQALCRRCSGTPVQHITGETGFRRLVLQVRAGVFVPRPETEVLVERVLDALHGVARPRVVDVGTGTGAIALSIKDERADARVIAIDRSPDAAELARTNAARLGLDVDVVVGELLEPIGTGSLERLDAVVSNPPYVAAEDYPALPTDVKADPIDSLVGDITIYRDLARQASERSAPGGVLGVEIGDTMGREVCAIIRAAGFVDVTLAQDLAGRDRVVTARMPA